jgi:hypothetical protein
MRLLLPAALRLAAIPLGEAAATDTTLRLNEEGHFETRGVNVLVVNRGASDILAVDAALHLVAERP